MSIQLRPSLWPAGSHCQVFREKVIVPRDDELLSYAMRTSVSIHKAVDHWIANVALLLRSAGNAGFELLTGIGAHFPYDVGCIDTRCCIIVACGIGPVLLLVCRLVLLMVQLWPGVL